MRYEGKKKQCVSVECVEGRRSVEDVRVRDVAGVQRRDRVGFKCRRSRNQITSETDERELLLRVSGRWNEPWKLSQTTVEVKVNKGCENLCVCHVIVE